MQQKTAVDFSKKFTIKFDILIDTLNCQLNNHPLMGKHTDLQIFLQIDLKYDN